MAMQPKQSFLNLRPFSSWAQHAQLVIMFVGFYIINLDSLALQAHSHAQKGSAKGKNQKHQGIHILAQVQSCVLHKCKD
jgi:hypothetical protein